MLYLVLIGVSFDLVLGADIGVSFDAMLGVDIGISIGSALGADIGALLYCVDVSYSLVLCRCVLLVDIVLLYRADCHCVIVSC